MSKHDIDDILSKLGEGGSDAPRRRLPAPQVDVSDAGTPGASSSSSSSVPAAPARRSGAKRRSHKIDEAEQSFSPLPAMPSGQRRRDEQDPAVKNKMTSAAPRVGDAVQELYRPEDGDDEQTIAELEQILVARNAVPQEKISAAKNVIKQSPGRRLTEVLVEQGADEAAIAACVADLAGVAFERIDLEKGLDGGFDGELVQRLGVDFCKEHAVVPLRREGRRPVIGSTRPDNVFLLDEVRRRLRAPGVKMVLVTPGDVKTALDAAGGEPEEDVDLSEILADVEEGDVEVQKSSDSEAVDLEQRAGESPVIRYVNYIIQTAIKEGASDIHIEPEEKRLKVRFRIDGVLFEMMNPPVSMSAAITSRLKIMANLDISERRVPQDGRIRCTVQGRKLDLRMSTLPTAAGEKTVLRILDTKSINVKLEQLGFSDDCYELWTRQVKAPHGIVLVTGPTGSGKTTTLYSSLRQLDKNKMNISTVEDPVEYHLDGITQTQTHDKIGMTFAKALKALLRQDPDVIMIGEIRDMDTAHIAVQAALTGHLVLSTLHTNDAPGSITRLINIGIEPFLIGGAVNAVLAQRLVRRLCTHCKQQAEPSEEMVDFLMMHGVDKDSYWNAEGCDKCRNTGYSGRLGVYELLVVDDQLRDVIAGNPNVAEFRRMCLERGMVSLMADGMTKAATGLTSVEEILRVTKEH